MEGIKVHYVPGHTRDMDAKSHSALKEKQFDSVTEERQEYATIFIFSEPQPINDPNNKAGPSPWKAKQSLLFYETALHPFHVSLRLCGLMYDVNSIKRFNMAKWYHCLVVVLVWLNFLRFYAAYNLGEPFGVLVTLKITIHGIIFFSVSCSVAAINMTRQRPIIFRAWHKYKTDFNQTMSDTDKRVIEQRINVTLAVSWLVLLTAIVIFIFAYNQDQLTYIFRLSLLPFVGICDEKYHKILYFLFIAVTNLFNTTIYVLQLGYLLIVVMGITDEFAQFNSEFHRCIIKSPPNTIDLEYWRKRHLELSKLTDLVDAGFGLFILLLFLANIGVCCFLVYMTVLTMAQDMAGEGMASVLAIFLFYLAMSVSIVFIITYAGTKLNTQVTTKARFVLFSIGE
jgi:hypothetical protein